MRASKPDNALNPTALSLLFINPASCDVACPVMPGGGLSTALGLFAIAST
jgi:hypothetical protein